MSLIEIIKYSEITKDRKQRLFARSQIYTDKLYEEVKFWIDKIKEEGDSAIIEYITKFDNYTTVPSQINFRVTKSEIDLAYKSISPILLDKIKEQIFLSKRFHTAFYETLPTSFQIEQVPGVIAGYKRVPIDSVGLYVPAGKAPLPTVAQILTVAAKTAKVPRVCIFYPPTKNEYQDIIIVAADLAGADEIYRIGGVAAIAAMAYGTNTIKPVMKIAGPGNPWVQTAKLQVMGQVGIDMFSGPSEVVLLADETSDPKFLAADILARCEHGPDSAAVLITTSLEIAIKTQQEVEIKKNLLDRQEYIEQSLTQYSAIILVDTVSEMITLTNEYMPEHLEIQTKDPEEIFRSIRSAGSTFIGKYAPVAVGDYASGTNHCLPTGKSTGFSSAVSPETFMKILQYQIISKDGLERLNPIVKEIATAEGLLAHKKSCEIRFENEVN